MAVFQIANFKTKQPNGTSYLFLGTKDNIPRRLHMDVRKIETYFLYPNNTIVFFNLSQCFSAHVWHRVIWKNKLLQGHKTSRLNLNNIIRFRFKRKSALHIWYFRETHVNVMLTTNIFSYTIFTQIDKIGLTVKLRLWKFTKLPWQEICRENTDFMTRKAGYF